LSIYFHSAVWKFISSYISLWIVWCYWWQGCYNTPHRQVANLMFFLVFYIDIGNITEIIVMRTSNIYSYFRPFNSRIHTWRPNYKFNFLDARYFPLIQFAGLWISTSFVDTIINTRWPNTSLLWDEKLHVYIGGLLLPLTSPNAHGFS